MSRFLSDVSSSVWRACLWVLLLSASVTVLWLLVGGGARAQSVVAPTIAHVAPGDTESRVAWTAPAGASGVVAYDVRHILIGLTNGVSYDVSGVGNSLPSGEWSATALGTPGDANGRPFFTEGDFATRTVPENTGPGVDVGAVVGASDPDYDPLSYRLDSLGKALFDMVASTGQLQTKVSFDYETRRVYYARVFVTDEKGDDGTADTMVDDVIILTVEVTDVNEPPMVSGPVRPDVAEGRRVVGSGYSATDPEGSTPSWSLSGDDAARFVTTVTNGLYHLTFAMPPDFESPSDADGDNVYEVTVEASDGALVGTLDVEVMVTDVNEVPSGGGGGSPTGGGGGGGGTGGGGPVDDGGGGLEVAPPRASELFEDVPEGVWYESAVSWMILHEVTQGCSPTLFCPDEKLTRQQFVTFLWRAAGKPASEYTGSEAFSDVEEGVYSDRAIGWAVAQEITLGCTQGSFGTEDWRFCPQQPVTRGQMATLLYRHTEADYIGAPPSYTDVAPDSFYTPGVSWLTDFEVVPGCGPDVFCPDRPATRAEAALFINGVAIRPHIWGEGNTSFIPTPG